MHWQDALKQLSEQIASTPLKKKNVALPKGKADSRPRSAAPRPSTEPENLTLHQRTVNQPQPSGPRSTHPLDWKSEVTPLPQANRAPLSKPKPKPYPMQRRKDIENVLRESLSDDFDVDSLLETDESLSYRADGVGPDVLKRLRRGHWALQAELDLHGMRRDEARAALSEFIRNATQAGVRCVRIIHGKGLSSVHKTPILKSKTQSWLVQKREVMAFVQARPSDGGAGALLVLLRGN